MPIVPPGKRIYVAYNHVPGGQIAVQHFDHVTRERKVGDDRTEKVEITIEEQIKGFEKSDFVAINVNGTIVKNKVIVYNGPEIAWNDPSAKIRVAEWAIAKGLAPIRTKEEKEKMTTEDTRRVEGLEKRMDTMESQAKESSAKIDQILEILTAAGAKK